MSSYFEEIIPRFYPYLCTRKAIQRQFTAACLQEGGEKNKKRRPPKLLESIWQLQRPFDTLRKGVNIPGVYFTRQLLCNIFLHLYRINKLHIHWVYSWNLIKSSKNRFLFCSVDSSSPIYLVISWQSFPSTPLIWVDYGLWADWHLTWGVQALQRVAKAICCGV